MAPMSTLADLGIQLRSSRPGEHRAPCPECAKVKIRPGDDALAIRLDADGHATWVCFRCTWSGAVGADRHHERRPQARPAAPEPDRRGAREAALRLWRSASPITTSTPAGAYLKRRGCALPHPNGDLRWVPNHRHPSGWAGPTMVGLVTNAETAAPMTLHMTWIRPDGGGKAPVERPRLLWRGLPKSGGVCRLWPDETVTLGLAVAEGVETALTASVGFGLAWATIDASNLKTLPILSGIALTIAVDNDPAGIAAAEVCAARWAEAGSEVRLWRAPTPGHDFNDFAQEKVA